MRTSANPFTPARGSLPARIVGREPERSAIREAIRRAGNGGAAMPLVFVGQRGMGKTALLRELRELGASRTLAVPLEIVRAQPLAETFREGLNGLLESVEGTSTRLVRAVERVVANVPKVSFELPHDVGAIAVEPASPADREREPEEPSFVTMLDALVRAGRSAKRYVTITVDEVQDVDPVAMQTLVRFVHQSAQTDAPVLFACAGLGETHALLDRLRTYVQRWTTFELRLATRAETIEAIREPILAAGATIDEAALDLLADEAAGYPYFIQAYASAAWEAHRGRRITVADVRTTLPDVRARNEASFYVRPLARLTPREIAFALALAGLGPGAHESGAVAAALGATAPETSSTRASLVRKGIVAAPFPGRVEFRMPFTDRYLLEHRDEYESPEVASYRERLGRRSGSLS